MTEAYLDASVIVSLLLGDTHSARAEQVSAQHELIVSDWAELEVSNVISRRARMGMVTRDEAMTFFANFDHWRRGVAESVETATADVRLASQFVRKPDVNLRSADALHLAIVHRIGAKLVTFDERLHKAAITLGVPTDRSA